jgi:PAP2 superfamily protein
VRSFLYWPPLRASRAIRASAWALVVIGAAAPLVRRRRNLPPARTVAAAAIAPVALTFAVRPGRARNVGVVALQMWAYVEAYKSPYLDPDRAAARAYIRYPIMIDRVLGLGQVPSVRLQRRFAHRGEVNHLERVLVWCHWLWFLVPHGSVAYVMVRRPDLFPSAAARMYAVFDLGAVCYWLAPTAPPWWAAGEGRVPPDGELAVRRMMREYGERFWGDRWADLYDLFGGNPLAAMPSLHFATSLMAARLLSETGPLAGALGWGYAGTLGLALVYLGEHYVVDLLAGAALTELVSRGARRLGPPVGEITRGIANLQRSARER